MKGFEREMNDEITRSVGREAEGVYVPDFAWQQRGPLSTAATGATGSEVVFDDFVPTEHRGDMFIEALRAKQVLSNLGTTYMSGLTGRIKLPKLATGATAGFVEELGDGDIVACEVLGNGDAIFTLEELSRRDVIGGKELRDDIVEELGDRDVIILQELGK